MNIMELEREVELCNAEAMQLGHSIEALAGALREDASRVKFKGDLILLDGHPRSPELALVVVNLAKIRNVVCNLRALRALRALQAQGKRLQAQAKKIRRAG